jgi:tetratricopeptide (TPR) repeat protein
MKKIGLIYLLLIISTFISCDNYLDVQPKGLSIPSSIEDFDLLLNGGDYTINTNADENALFLTADDFVSTDTDLGDLSNPNNKEVKLYTWSKDLFTEETEEYSWNFPYKNIYEYNVVIESIDQANSSIGYTSDDKKVIKAEAKVGRAYEYWLLVNTFAKQYSETSAATDLGVPLITEPNVTGEVSNRSTVKEIYDFIIKDVEESIEYLPSVAKNAVRPSKGTGYAMLARFYLSMSDYENALKNANLAINEKGDIADYNQDLNSSYDSEQYIKRLFGYTGGFIKGMISDDLKNSFDLDNDTRATKILRHCVNQYNPSTGTIETVCSEEYRNSYSLASVNNSVSVPEMYLIRAECNARLSSGTISEIVDDMNSLRVKRYSTGTYTNLNVSDFSDKAEALTFVLQERRRELFMNGMRLFDLKRLNLDPLTAKTVTHTVNGVDYVMEPGANNLVLPIPGQVMNLASNLTQNPRD